MVTSANVTYYDIYNKHGNFVKTHSQHHYCKSRKHELFEYKPAEEFFIVVRWPDEDEAVHESEKMLLSDYLNGKEYELT